MENWQIFCDENELCIVLIPTNLYTFTINNVIGSNYGEKTKQKAK